MQTFHRPARSGRRIAAFVALLLLAVALPAAAQVTNRYNETIAGDVVMVGNNLVHCGNNTAACVTARNAVTPGAGHNQSTGTLGLIDIDGDASTANSSSATLTLPAGATVRYARLYWAGMTGEGTARRRQAKFRTPAMTAYIDVNTAQVTANARINFGYMSHIDVTALVQAGGSGTYTVGNIAADTLDGDWAGWVLVVAYAHPSEPVRNLTVFDGWSQGTGATEDITVTGFLTPISGAVNSRLGFALFDGDRGTLDGTVSLAFGPTTATLSPVSDANNPVNDVFNSTISNLGTYVTARNPAYQNTLGVDIDRMVPNTPLPNGTTTAVMRINSQSNDFNWRGVFTLANEVHVPNLTASIAKVSSDVNGDTLLPGEEVLYTITSTNTGNDNSILNVLTDPIPANMTYVPGSLVVNSGANAGAKTDAAGDDQAEFLTGPNRVVFRLGTGANAATGGTVTPGAGFSVSFRARVNAGTANGATLTNTASLAYRGATLPTDYTATATASNTINTTSGVAVSKSNSQATYTPGVQTTYTLVIGNTGPAAAHGAVVRDTPPAGMTFGAITCTGTTGGAVCPSGAGFNVTALGDGTGITIATLPNGGQVTLQVTATVN